MAYVAAMGTTRWSRVGAALLAAALAGCGSHASKSPAAAQRSNAAAAGARSCSRGIATMLRAIPQPMNVVAYVTPGEPELDAFSASLERVLRDLESANAGKLRAEIVRVTTPEQRQAALDAGLEEAAFAGQTPEGVPTKTPVFVGMAFRYRSAKGVIPVLPPDTGHGLRFWIANKMREVRERGDDVRHRIGVMTGTGEIKLTEPNLLLPSPDLKRAPTIRDIVEDALPFYRFEEVDTKRGSAEVPPGVEALIVTQPGRSLDDRELARIDEFLMRGKKGVAIFAGAVNVAPSNGRMPAELDTRGLERLLAGYGVEMRREALLDWARGVTIPAAAGGKTLSYRSPGIIQAAADSDAGGLPMLDHEFLGFFRLDELVFPFPSPLVPHPDKQRGATMRVVARTTPRATVDASRSLSMGLATDWKPNGDFAQRAIGISIEGVLRSAFTGAPAKGPGHLVVISASQFLANPFARASAAGSAAKATATDVEDIAVLAQPYAQKYLVGTILAFKNILDWLTLDDDLIACSAESAN